MAYNKDIDTLLDLDGIVIEQINGYWTKFEVRKLASATEERPHGIQYSLTLHDRSGNRVLGFDNAHAIKERKYRQKRKIHDHFHRYAKSDPEPYEFINPHKLLKDFWIEVDKVLKKLEIEEM